MKLTTYLLTSAAFILAGICFAKQPTGALGPLLCGTGMALLFWRAYAFRCR